MTIVNYVHPAAAREPSVLPVELRALFGWAEGLRRAGAEVNVVQGFVRDAVLEHRGVRYELVRERASTRLRGWQIPRRLHRRVAELAPDVVHVNGLLFAAQARALRRLLPSPTCLVLQHHAETPRHGVAGLVEKWALGAAEGFFFTGHVMAEPWHARGALRPWQPVFEIMEGSSHFRPASGPDLAAARRQTGLRGSPVALWAGNLDTNKDPLTVLDGFEKVLEKRPSARLYMTFRGARLLGQVRRRVASSPALTSAVTLVGQVPYADMEAYFKSADLFVQGSHREGSGFALVDAMACGVLPVVTDIPSFRYMTGDGAVGVLWPAGDVAGFADAFLAAAGLEIEAAHLEVREHFELHLSWDVIGRQALEAYRELHRRRLERAGRRGGTA